MNRWRRWLQVSAIVLTGSWAGCSAPGTESRGETLGKSKAALSIPGLKPIPCANGRPTWVGSNVQLMVADAWAECTVEFGVGLTDGEVTSTALQYYSAL